MLNSKYFGNSKKLNKTNCVNRNESEHPNKRRTFGNAL